MVGKRKMNLKEKNSKKKKRKIPTKVIEPQPSTSDINS